MGFFKHFYYFSFSFFLEKWHNNFFYNQLKETQLSKNEWINCNYKESLRGALMPMTSHQKQGSCVLCVGGSHQDIGPAVAVWWETFLQYIKKKAEMLVIISTFSFSRRGLDLAQDWEFKVLVSLPSHIFCDSQPNYNTVPPSHTLVPWYYKEGCSCVWGFQEPLTSCDGWSVSTFSARCVRIKSSDLVHCNSPHDALKSPFFPIQL